MTRKSHVALVCRAAAVAVLLSASAPALAGPLDDAEDPARASLMRLMSTFDWFVSLFTSSDSMAVINNMR